LLSDYCTFVIQSWIKSFADKNKLKYCSTLNSSEKDFNEQ